MDSHKYTRLPVRKLRPKRVMICDADCVQHAFLFDPHYALSTSHWQELKTDGSCRLVMIEALGSPASSLNISGGNAVSKSLIGTLIKFPGPVHCADQLLCIAGFFQVNVPESASETRVSDL